MGVVAFAACKPCRGVAGCGAGALRDLVALGIVLSLAIVEGADDDGAVDVSFYVIKDDFLPYPWDEAAAPVGAGGGFCYAYPDVGGFIAGSVIAALRVGVAAGRLRTALPWHLDFYLVVALGGDVCSGGADDDSGVDAVGGGLGVQ